jgi:hypothetical protein
MRPAWRFSLVLPVLALTVSACSSGSGGTPGTTTVTTTVTATASTPTMSPPHVVATPPESRATTSATAGAVARCDGPSLAVTVGAGEGAGGTIHYPVVFTNHGTASCYLQGFPGVAAADASRAPKVDAARDTSTSPARVILAAGGSAHADLAVRNVPPGSGPCPSYPLLLVTPPDSRRTSTISRSVQRCAAQMRVTVVRPGRS